jgi:hypothetical protein
MFSVVHARNKPAKISANFGLYLPSTSISGTGGSNPSSTIYGPRPRARVEVQTRFGTRLQSYIRPACGASEMPWALMDFRAVRSAISLAASRAMVGDRVGKRRSDQFTVRVTQRTLCNLGKSGFQCHIRSLITRILRSALS